MKKLAERGIVPTTIHSKQEDFTNPTKSSWKESFAGNSLSFIFYSMSIYDIFLAGKTSCTGIVVP